MTAEQTAEKNRWIALVILCTGFLMIVLDATVVNVALPSIQDDLGFSASSLAWVVNAYLIAFGGLLLLAGRLGDLISRRGMFLSGLVVFTLASLACGVSQSEAMLVGARFVQGVGGAMTSAVILGMIFTMFPEPREQAKAMGVFSFVASGGGSVGLIAGGVLTDLISWHWIFFINLPIGIATGILALRYVKADRGAGFGQGADVLGAVLSTAALMLLVYTIVQPAAQDGWGATSTLLFAAGAVVLGIAFVVRESTASHPLIPLRIFKVREVAAANAIQGLLVAGMFGTFFMGSLYLQRVLHYSPLEIGLAFLPLTVVMGTVSVRYTERLIMRFGPRRTLVPGMSLVLVGLLLFARTPVDGNYLRDLLPIMPLIGLGFAICGPSLVTLAMSGAHQDDAGLASGLINTVTQVGGALGLAVLATLASEHTASLRDAGESTASALNSGYHLGYLVAAGLTFVALVIAGTVLRERGTAAVPAHAQSEPDTACAEAA
ncbi:MAG TPA: DHA2 family efflux MFS transporter permease subunit [Thermoleophilaceae bacterium]|nr:DHA2 family efflux MFS transporter permease subunit [Thermoleophilaceae bacterium]